MGHWYGLQSDYETTAASEGLVAFVELPNALSVYVNGVGGMVALSIGGRSTEGGSSGDHMPVGPPEALGPDYFATPSLLTPLPAGPPVPEEHAYSPEVGREAGGVRTPRDGPPVGPLRGRHCRFAARS